MKWKPDYDSAADEYQRAGKYAIILSSTSRHLEPLYSKLSTNKCNSYFFLQVFVLKRLNRTINVEMRTSRQPTVSSKLNRILSHNR